MTMNCLIVTIGLACVAIQLVLAAPADEIDCSKIEEVFEDQGAASSVSYTNEKYVRALTKEQLEKRCPEMNNAVKTIRKYNQKCNTGLTQQVFSAGLKSKQQYVDRFCKDSDSDYVKKALESFKCGEDKLKDQLKAQEEKANIMTQILGETQFKDDKERVTRVCCSIVQQKEDLFNLVRPQCESSIPYLNDYVDSLLADTMSLVCPDIATIVKSGDCSKLAPLPVEGIKAKYTFALAPMIKVVKSMEH